MYAVRSTAVHPEIGLPNLTQILDFLHPWRHSLGIDPIRVERRLCLPRTNAPVRCGSHKYLFLLPKVDEFNQFNQFISGEEDSQRWYVLPSTETLSAVSPRSGLLCQSMQQVRRRTAVLLERCLVVVRSSKNRSKTQNVILNFRVDQSEWRTNHLVGKIGESH